MKWAILSQIWKLLFGNRAKLAEINQVYVTHIEYLNKQLEEQRAIIAEYKKRHPENGEEMDRWKAREEKMHSDMIKQVEQNRNLREQIIFLEAELKTMKKKHRSMYE